MPEMSFWTRWPDGSKAEHYSPSLVIKDFFSEGEALPLAEFLARTRQALAIASDRVQAKYGFACTRAHATMSAIERQAEHFKAMPDASVIILGFSA